MPKAASAISFTHDAGIPAHDYWIYLSFKFSNAHCMQMVSRLSTKY